MQDKAKPPLWPGDVWRVECRGKEYLVLIVEKPPTVARGEDGLLRSRLVHGDIEALGEPGARANIKWLIDYEFRGTAADLRFFCRYVTTDPKPKDYRVRSRAPVRFLEKLGTI